MSNWYFLGHILFLINVFRALSGSLEGVRTHVTYFAIYDIAIHYLSDSDLFGRCCSFIEDFFLIGFFLNEPSREMEIWKSFNLISDTEIYFFLRLLEFVDKFSFLTSNVSS